MLTSLPRVGVGNPVTCGLPYGVSRRAAEESGANRLRRRQMRHAAGELAKGTPVYGLPADVDLTFLNGATLTQVCVGENEVVLNLDNNASIMIASTVRILGSGQDGTELQEAAQTGAALLPLLGKAIVTAVGDAGGWTTQ